MRYFNAFCQREMLQPGLTVSFFKENSHVHMEVYGETACKVRCYDRTSVFPVQLPVLILNFASDERVVLQFDQFQMSPARPWEFGLDAMLTASHHPPKLSQDRIENLRK